MKKTDLASGLVAMLLACAPVSVGQSIASEISSADVHADFTVLSIDAGAEKEESTEGRSVSRLVLLPPDADNISVEVLEGAAKASLESASGFLRGLRAAEIRIDLAGDAAARIAIHHDGTWADFSKDRLLGHSRSVAAAAGLSTVALLMALSAGYAIRRRFDSSEK